MGRHNLSEEIRQIINTFQGEPFLIRDIFDRLDRSRVAYDPDTIRKTVPHAFKMYGWVQKIGKLDTNEGVYQSAASPPMTLESAIDIILARQSVHAQKRKTVAHHVRDIVQAYAGDRFTMDDIAIDLDAMGIVYKRKVVSSALGYMKRKGRIRVVETIKGENIYQQTDAKALDPADPPTQAIKPRKTPDPANFSAVCFAAMAALERFSMQALAHGIARGGQWTHGDALQKIPSVIQRIKSAGMLTASGTRPAVYHMTPRWYLDNLENLPVYQDAAPHFFDRIVDAFFRHCGPGQGQDDPAPEIDNSPPPIDTAATVVDDLKAKIEDQGIRLINIKNRAHSLESENRKLKARIDRLTDTIDEKNRVNKAIQKRLNDVLHGAKKRQATAGAGFALGELLHVSGSSEKGGLNIIDGTQGPAKERLVK